MSKICSECVRPGQKLLRSFWSGVGIILDYNLKDKLLRMAWGFCGIKCPLTFMASLPAHRHCIPPTRAPCSPWMIVTNLFRCYKEELLYFFNCEMKHHFFAKTLTHLGYLTSFPEPSVVALRAQGFHYWLTCPPWSLGCEERDWLWSVHFFVPASSPVLGTYYYCYDFSVYWVIALFHVLF